MQNNKITQNFQKKKIYKPVYIYEIIIFLNYFKH